MLKSNSEIFLINDVIVCGKRLIIYYNSQLNEYHATINDGELLYNLNIESLQLSLFGKIVGSFYKKQNTRWVFRNYSNEYDTKHYLSELVDTTLESFFIDIIFELIIENTQRI